MKRQQEFFVGLLVLLGIGCLGIFAWVMGFLGPLQGGVRYHVLYDFAGGVELGSPVRVGGVRVGKVEKIRFLAEKSQTTPEASLEVTLTVSHQAARHVRADSKFYINMAGIIGERYIEVSPGGSQSPLLPGGTSVRGIDPPRIDQLLSQGYGVFGKFVDFIEKNEETATAFFTNLKKFMGDANKVLKGSDLKKFTDLVETLNSLGGDLRVLTKKLHQPETQEVLSKLYDMIDRAHTVDRNALKKFLQDEGIRARIF